MPELDLAHNSRILVAGASSDIGMALTARLLESPVRLGLHGFRSVDRLRPLTNQASRSTVRVFRRDLRSGSAAIRLVKDFCSWAGGIDALVQLTGSIERPVSWTEMRVSDWNADFALNCTAPFFLAHAALKRMKNGGRIVLMSTASATHGCGPDTMAYGLAKAATEASAKALARAGAAHGVLVNAVCPGFILTRFHPDRVRRSETDIARRASLVPLGRGGTADDVAWLILFLLSEANQFITGQCIAVSGGDFI